jgi:ABC-type uncharacterized transport system permease subunit
LVLSYCVWFAIVTLSVWFVKLESGAVAFDPVMQMARFPVEIYPARMRSFLTFALPVAFMTTFPTEALLGRTDVRVLIGGAGVRVCDAVSVAHILQLLAALLWQREFMRTNLPTHNQPRFLN